MPDYPKIGGASAADVWAYATRAITDKAGFTISGTKTTLDALNDITSASVWTEATRDLTDKVGFGLASQVFPFTNPGTAVDLANVQGALSPTATGRAAKIDDIPYFEAVVEGSLLMSGAEQTLVEKLDDKAGLVEGMINLAPMASGDTVVVREYMQVISTGTYAKYAEETYADAQAISLLQLLTRISTHDIKVTIQQTAGTYRTFEYSFVRRKET